MMRTKTTVPINTLDEAFELAQVLLQDLGSEESKAFQRFRIFSALANNEGEALAAFLIWRARGETIRELTHSA